MLKASQLSGFGGRRARGQEALHWGSRGSYFLSNGNVAVLEGSVLAIYDDRWNVIASQLLTLPDNDNPVQPVINPGQSSPRGHSGRRWHII